MNGMLFILPPRQQRKWDLMHTGILSSSYLLSDPLMQFLQILVWFFGSILNNCLTIIGLVSDIFVPRIRSWCMFLLSLYGGGWINRGLFYRGGTHTPLSIILFFQFFVSHRPCLQCVHFQRSVACRIFHWISTQFFSSNFLFFLLLFKLAHTFAICTFWDILGEVTATVLEKEETFPLPGRGYLISPQIFLYFLYWGGCHNFFLYD